MRFAETIAALCALLLLGSCLATDAEDTLARQTFADVRAGKFEAVEARLAPQFRTPEARAAMEQIRGDIIPAGEPQGVRLLNSSKMATLGGPARTYLQHEYRYADRILIAETRLIADANGASLVEGFSVTPFDLSAAARDFSFAQATRLHFAFFGALVVSCLLMLLAFAGTLFTRDFKRKWLWLIVSLIGAGAFRMNWDQGLWTFQPLAVSILGAGVTRGLSPLDPWIVSFHLPAGALIVLTLLWPRWAGRARA